MKIDLTQALFLITVGKLIVGTALLSIVGGSLYRFRKGILTVMGLLLLSNIVCLFLIMATTQR